MKPEADRGKKQFHRWCLGRTGFCLPFFPPFSFPLPLRPLIAVGVSARVFDVRSEVRKPGRTRVSFPPSLLFFFFFPPFVPRREEGRRARLQIAALAPGLHIARTTSFFSPFFLFFSSRILRRIRRAPPGCARYDGSALQRERTFPFFFFFFFSPPFLRVPSSRDGPSGLGWSMYCKPSDFLFPSFFLFFFFLSPTGKGFSSTSDRW